MFGFCMSVALSCSILKGDQLINVLSHGTRDIHAVGRNMPRAEPERDVSGTDRTGCSVKV